VNPPDWSWLNNNISKIVDLTGQHLVLALAPVVAALVLSIPIGYLISLSGKASNAILAVFGLIYAIPSLALFVAMPVILGTQILAPINIAAALTVYAVALLVRSVVDGLRGVPAEVKRSASAMGYGRVRRLFAVELPLSMPVIFAGLRVVTVSNIALVSVGEVIGLGALGSLFSLGFNKAFYTPIVVGLVLTVVLALIADGLILLLQRGTLPWFRKQGTA